MAKNRSESLKWIAGGLAAAGAYYFAIRPAMLKWGAAPAEIQQSFPGDNLISQPELMTTRAITIKAPADKVWPWMLQIGYQRGGFYSYDFLEEKAGLSGIQSAKAILPELQNIKEGDQILISPVTPMDVAVLEPNRAMVLHMVMSPFTAQPVEKTGASPWFDWSWAFVLEAPSSNVTRLVIRTRAAYSPRLLAPLVVALLDPVHYLMERRMLETIKQRVEATYTW